MLRHSTITLTANTYTSVLPEVAHRAAEAAVALIPRTTGDPAGRPGERHRTERDD
jgi:hypothetical protein